MNQGFGPESGRARGLRGLGEVAAGPDHHADAGERFPSGDVVERKDRRAQQPGQQQQSEIESTLGEARGSHPNRCANAVASIVIIERTNQRPAERWRSPPFGSAMATQKLASEIVAKATCTTRAKR